MNILYKTDKETDLVITHGDFAHIHDDSSCVDKLYEYSLSTVFIYDDEVSVDINLYNKTRDRITSQFDTGGYLFVISMDNLVKLIDEFGIDQLDHDTDEGIGELGDIEYYRKLINVYGSGPYKDSDLDIYSDLIYLPKFKGQINMVGNFSDHNWEDYDKDDPLGEPKSTFCELLFKDSTTSATFIETHNRLIDGLEFLRLQKIIRNLLMWLNLRFSNGQNKYLMMEIIKCEYPNVSDYNIFKLLS